MHRFTKREAAKIIQAIAIISIVPLQYYRGVAITMKSKDFSDDATLRHRIEIHGDRYQCRQHFVSL